MILFECGPGSSFGIATGYWQDGPGTMLTSCDEPDGKCREYDF
jgi:hypothetical protein